MHFRKYIMLLLLITSSCIANSGGILKFPSGNSYEVLSIQEQFLLNDGTSALVLTYKSDDLKNLNQLKLNGYEIMSRFGQNLNQGNYNFGYIIASSQKNTKNFLSLNYSQSEQYSIKIQKAYGKWIIIPPENLPNNYSNDLLRFSVDKSKNWFYHWHTEPESNIEDDHIKNLRLKELQRISIMESHISFTKQKEPISGTNSTLNISVVSINDTNIYGIQLLNGLMKNLNPTKVISPPHVIEIKNDKAFMSEFNFKPSQSEDIFHGKLIHIIHGNWVYKIEVFYNEDTLNLKQLENEIDQMISSFTIL